MSSFTVGANVEHGQIKLLEPLEMPDGTRALVTLLVDDSDFWLRCSEKALDAVWGNFEDDVYDRLLAK